jgi:protein SSD1
MKSLEAVHDPAIRQILELLSRKATGKAKYFCTGMIDIAKYQHYSLSVPLYTHFTSPIRRYADVLVHRQLDSILQAGGERKWIFIKSTSDWLTFDLPRTQVCLGP